MPRLCKLGGLVLAWLFATVQSLPAYYINMDDLTERARLMDTHLRELGFTDPPWPGLDWRGVEIVDEMTV